jgi:hypothetical protein
MIQSMVQLTLNHIILASMFPSNPMLEQINSLLIHLGTAFSQMSIADLLGF